MLHVKGRPRGGVPPLRRHYTNNSRGIPKEYVYTKYRISLPLISNVQYDDMYLSRPSRDDLYAFTKKVPIFLRYLKLITSMENRNDDFLQFAKRCESGLTTEKDVYLTKEELLDVMFLNGYSKKEINALDLAFTNKYKFHYPEIAALFKLEEEEVYKYCLKKRSENPEELIHLKCLKPQNLLSSYGLIFVFLYFGLNNVVLSNAWFLSKTIPFFSVFYMLGSHFYRDIWSFLNKGKKLMAEQNEQNQLAAEEILYKQLKLYSKDTECSANLANFKTYSGQLISMYRRAYIQEERKKIHHQLEKKLNEMHNAEVKYKQSLQQIVVNEMVNMMYQKVQSDPQFYSSILNDSINNIRGITQEDTLIKHVKKELSFVKQLDKQNPLVKNVLAQYELKKGGYVNQFVVHKEEANKVRAIISKCGLDLNKLNQEERNQLLQLYVAINNRFGFYTNEEELPLVVPRDEHSGRAADSLNRAVAEANRQARERHLQAFMRAFQ
ncbi:vacuolar membrane protein-related, putative [Plasmodium vivax]|uniref:Uncharacterized protein n=6 Tax=Plasmodium vivax TaxID=5855 RepID=A5K4R2_PLAVS|nr:hypothetical protein, conserved [Plasmodium vivax]KMZ80497.1 hypothetical protein PVIIG_03749 [Plasmodium vivax India VII]KMZ86602.1 hypothetical protein PVBG_04938 [Plasmodium vivax Brazil I]KMZ93054.1 hypothetical protein PVMG_04204 [Plasmodium vivax Mauritania I]KMZ99514.1 hypothetical protein PVNG_02241 [Plasmodium vivax North Korean]EDL45640.1 hypothetical protein, conserved [Plasmodium vivax]|eukprot:XP_001615367.1 hypothetical protein [Plasmodium vivax Sal-1]